MIPNPFYIYALIVSFSDFSIVVSLLIEEGVSETWFNRIGFIHSRKFLILLWLMLGNILLMSYKGNLRANLVAITYKKPIDSIQDMEESGLPLLFCTGCGYKESFAADPRPAMNRLAEKAIMYKYDGSMPDHILNM